ncbi:MAG: prepilin-type N-terminal cleavage/methylation domain-containing protein [Oscillatoriales cyanobacterium SM2_2_1]|nr:prepilin-type N-terminal cleavage/methylation domain-containing protein [Oscillatoriales cyanobacterium SM2_2_1]
MGSTVPSSLGQYLWQQRRSERAFTLVELLVVIIIIGILAAIALPTFLSQANKAKQSEARVFLGALTKGQQAYFNENNRFGSSLEVLGVGVNSASELYEFKSAGAPYDPLEVTNNFATAVAISRAASLRSYIGRVNLTVVVGSSDVNTIAILCENRESGEQVPDVAIDTDFVQISGAAAVIRCQGTYAPIGD